MIKIYCEDNALTKEVRALAKQGGVVLIGFPFEKKNKRLKVKANKPSNLKADSTLVTADSTIRIGDTIPSNKHTIIEEIVGKGRNHFNDVRIIDTAYKEGCSIFITTDIGDIVSNGNKLEDVTGMKFYTPDDIEKIKETLITLKS